MTGLLLRLFVKDADNTENPAVHTSIGKMAGFTGICCNILLFLGKLLAGLLSGSVSILADAINNLSDAGSSLVTLLGFYLAQRPADKEHPYGHARYEYLSGLVVSTLILVIGLELGKSSFEKVLHPQPILATPVVWGVLTVSLCLKLWMSHFFRTLGARIRSVTLTAASADSRNDVIATAGVLLGYIALALRRLFSGPASALPGTPSLPCWVPGIRSWSKSYRHWYCPTKRYWASTTCWFTITDRDSALPPFTRNSVRRKIRWRAMTLLMTLSRTHGSG